VRAPGVAGAAGQRHDAAGIVGTGEALPHQRTGPGGAAVFAKSDGAKARLVDAVPDAERETALNAPVTAILSHRNCGPGDGGGHRDGALHAAYLMLAARALGLDCGPIWRFDAPLVQRLFFNEDRLAASFLCALGYGDATQPRSPEPRPDFDEACAIL
jgi:3-hydroxypropanoate dehydrogenase